MIVTIQCKRISCLFDTNTNNVFKTKLPLFKLDKCKISKFMKMTVPNDNAKLQWWWVQDLHWGCNFYAPKELCICTFFSFKFEIRFDKMEERIVEDGVDYFRTHWLHQKEPLDPTWCFYVFFSSTNTLENCFCASINWLRYYKIWTVLL